MHPDSEQHGDGGGDEATTRRHGRARVEVGEPPPRRLPCLTVISLDAATVLLQWAVGGMAFCWFTTRRRQVGLGYGWLLRGIYAVMAVGAFAAGMAFGVVPVREAASLGVVATCLARARRVRRPPAGRRRRPARRARPAHGAGRGDDRHRPRRAGRADASPTDPSSRRSSTSCRSLVGCVGLVAAALDAGGNTAVVAAAHVRQRRLPRRGHRRHAARPLVPRAARAAARPAQRARRRRRLGVADRGASPCCCRRG